MYADVLKSLQGGDKGMVLLLHTQLHVHLSHVMGVVVQHQATVVAFTTVLIVTSKLMLKEHHGRNIQLLNR